MIYRTGVSRDGGLATGCEEEWEYSRLNGNYDDGSDFFYVHWETKDRDPYNIRFHIEAPKYSIDPVLNSFKQSVINAILNSDIEHIVIEKGFNFKLGKYIEDKHIKRNKSTEVFRVMLSTDQAMQTHKENIEEV